MSAHRTLTRIGRIVAIILTTIATFLALAVNPAGAIEGPTDVLPGGNGPDPEEPIVLVPGFLIPLGPTASATVSCTTETATVTVGNKTNSFHPITVKVDGVDHDAGTVGPNQQWTTSVPIAENGSLQLDVLNGSTTLLSEALHRDCLTPVPGYEILTDCGLGKAHARLTNTGTDTAHMAVQYHPNPYAVQPVAPGDHLDWELVVAPNGTVDFTIRAGNESIGVESLHFECATPVIDPPEEPEVEEPADESEPEEQPEVEEPAEESEVDEAPTPETPQPPAPADAPTPDASPVDTTTGDNDVETEVDGAVEIADGAPDAADESVDADAVGEGAAEDAAEASAEEAGAGDEDSSDDSDDSDDLDGLAFADMDTFQRDPGGSLGRTIVTLLWGAAALLAVATGLLAWRRRDDRSAAVAGA